MQYTQRLTVTHNGSKWFQMKYKIKDRTEKIQRDNRRVYKQRALNVYDRNEHFRARHTRISAYFRASFYNPNSMQRMSELIISLSAKTVTVFAGT